MMATCKVDGCDKSVYVNIHRMCARHYRIAQRGNMLEKAFQDKCTAPDCGQKVYAKGLCRSHYKMKRKWSRLDITRPKRDHICSVDGCEGKHHARGLCSHHYEQKRQKKYTKSYDGGPLWK